MQYVNIMYDRRVVRGNTYAQALMPKQEIKKIVTRRRKIKYIPPTTPLPVEGRQHIRVQTELYLEELSDRIIVSDVSSQTDNLLDRPATPLFIPAKSGKDVDTQILEGELFDFDIEVKPILEVMVGKIIEQSLLEVSQEEELATFRAQQRAFEELRNAELAEAQRLEEQERRRREEKERRLKQQREVIQKEKETVEKIAAQTFAKHYLADLITSVYCRLWNGGYFYDPVERDVETKFMPWLMKEVDQAMYRPILGRKALDSK
uniref:Radial spoke head 3 n=1 Tax=Erpetoichthys calabaricus TaxID=27687 RepID=A0A8C4X2W2_ERPCA